MNSLSPLALPAATPNLTEATLLLGRRLSAIATLLGTLAWVGAELGWVPLDISLPETLAIMAFGMRAWTAGKIGPRGPILIVASLLLLFVLSLMTGLMIAPWTGFSWVQYLRHNHHDPLYLTSVTSLMIFSGLAVGGFLLALRKSEGEGLALWLGLLTTLQAVAGLVAWLVFSGEDQQALRALVGVSPVLALPLGLLGLGLAGIAAGRPGALSADARFVHRLGKLIGAMTAMSIVSLTIWGAIVVTEFGDYRTNLRVSTANAARLLEEHAERTLDAAFMAIDRVTERLAERGFEEVTSSRREWNRVLSILNGIPQVSSLLVTDANGKVRLFTVAYPPPNIDVSDLDYFSSHQATWQFSRISPPFVSRSTGRTVFTVSKRITDEYDGFRGVVAANIDVEYFGRVYEQIQNGPGSFISILKQDGMALVRYPPDPLHPLPGTTIQNLLPAPAPDALHGEISGRTPDDGILRLITFRQSPERGLTVAVGIALAESDNNFLEDQIRSLSLIVVFLLLLGLFTWAALRELHREQAARMALTELAATDPLTKLKNRRAFETLGQHEIIRVRRFGQPLAVLMLDIDHFKRVNDHFGHDVGDQVLVALADTCRRLLREVDVVGRLGGEEFAVILPGATAQGALAVAEKLRLACGEIDVASAKGSVRFTIWIGVSFLTDADTLPDLLHRADIALYKAKNNGRNRVEVG